MESQQRKIEEKFSFRVLSLPKKKGPHKTFAFTASSQERTTKRALEGVRVCVCVCVDLESKQHIHTDRKKWRQTGCLVEETPPRVVLSVTTPKEIITF